MDEPSPTESGPRSQVAERLAAVALLAAGLVVALVGWYAVWLVVGLLTTSSSGLPLCPAGQALITGIPALALGLLAAGTLLVGIQWRRGRTVWGLAIATLAGVLVSYAAFAVIAVTVGRDICI